MKVSLGFLLPHFTVAFFPLSREAMLVQAKTCDLQEPVFGNLKAETKKIRPRVPAITEVWKETREKPDLPPPQRKCSHPEQDFQIGEEKS